MTLCSSPTKDAALDWFFRKYEPVWFSKGAHGLLEETKSLTHLQMQDFLKIYTSKRQHLLKSVRIATIMQEVNHAIKTQLILKSQPNSALPVLQRQNAQIFDN